VAAPWWNRFHEYRHVWLLVTLCLLEVLYPITRSVYTGYRLLELFFVLVFIACVYAVANRRWFRIIALILVTPSLLSFLSVAGFNIFADKAPLWLIWIRAVATLFILLFSGIVILGQVFRAKRINTDKVCGAVAVFMIFGAVWTTLYAMVLLASPDAIYFPEPVVEVSTAEAEASTTEGDHELENFHSLNYFSFVTLSTLGYGDIQPVSPIARMLAWVEAVFGQLYLAVLIGNIVGLQVAHMTGEVAKPKKDTDVNG
jgi:hypothetical protein